MSGPEASGHPAALDVQGLSAGYGSKEVLHRVAFDAAPGTVSAIIGLNGAGKSTLLRTIAGLKTPTEGRVLVGDLDPHKRAGRRADIALVLQGVVIDRQLTGAEYLEFAARARGLSRKLARETVASVVEELGLEELMSRRGNQLSGGQARRIQLASSLVRRPRLLLLDEPTGGLDPSARRQYWPLIRGLASRGVTVVVVTHYIEEANLADDVVVISDGRVVSRGRPDRLVSSAALSVVRIECGRPESAEAINAALLPHGAERSELVVSVATEDPAQAMETVRRLGLEEDVELHVRPAALDDLLIRLATEEVRLAGG